LVPAILLTAVIAGGAAWFIGATVFYGYVFGVRRGAGPGSWIMWFEAATSLTRNRSEVATR